MIKRLLLILLLCTVIFTTSISAGGFQINEHGARAMALAGAFTGLANDPSAVYFNPAGITQLRGTQFMGGVTFIAPNNEFTGPNPNSPAQSQTEWEMNTEIFYPINFYVTHQFSEKVYAGFGVSNPYGLGTEWNDDWSGRYLAVDTELRTFFFYGVLAYKFSEQFSLSAGINYATGDVSIVRMLPQADPVTQQLRPDAKTELEGDGSGVGFSAGLLFKPTPKFQVGVSYRSEVTFDFEGDATTDPKTLDFTHPLAGPQSIELPNGPIKAELTTPQNLAVGVAFLPTDKLTLTADFQWIGWSSYDSLTVEFQEYDDPQTGNRLTQSSPRLYEDTFILRGGAEYKFSPEFALRGGLLYDSNPVQDEYVEPTLPDSDRLGLNIGFGYNFTEDLSVDFAYLLLLFTEREITDSKVENPDLTVQATSNNPFFNGTYNSSAHLFGLNLKYTLN